MAFRAARYWRSVVEHENANRSMMRSFVSTAPKNASSASTALNNEESKRRSKWLTPEMVPIVVLMTIPIGIGIHTLYKNLVHAPSVKLTKTNRGSISEADHPDEQTNSGGKFVNTSFLRKVGHIQNSSRH
ncbi:hypothetical protein POM88_042874 [Heracleum sosnowskyi]|uniref:Uncharacterized protein n=1 Tax=Heracleum sosnowskyi TaxID=360622 RepID=A0AAD8HIH2_9APIA|nr:hypothetical protein POM88_042874 [Heracleum sosnowskyi]